MARNPLDMGALRLGDSDDDNPFDFPEQSRDNGTSQVSSSNGKAQQPTPSRTHVPKHRSDEAREAALRKELESVRGVNKVIEDVIASLEKAKGNMDTVHRTVQSASTLLGTWTKILSQTEHNQRLLLNPSWQGATQDREDAENESLLKQQAAERRAAEEQMRQEAASRQADEEERKRAATPSGARGPRGRVRGSGLGRGTTSGSASSAYVGVGGQGGRGKPIVRAGSGIGRGVAGTRGRGRGVG